MKRIVKKIEEDETAGEKVELEEEMGGGFEGNED